MRSVGLLSLLTPLAAAACSGPRCDAIPGAEALFRQGAVILLGEIHGTREAPAIVAHLACEARSRHLSATVGLEIPRSEQDAFDAYLSSEGTDEDRNRFLENQWWQRDYQDGRSSRAMLELLDALRHLGTNGPDLNVVLIDDPASSLGRDRAMAERLGEEIERRPGDVFIVLTGNLHSRLVPGRFEPMGHHLRQRNPDADIVSLNITHGGGTAWICTPSGCGEQTLGGQDRVAPGVELYEPSPDAAYSGRLHVPRITASPPAGAPNADSPG